MCESFVLFNRFHHKYSLNKERSVQKSYGCAKRKSKPIQSFLISANGYFNGMSLVESHVVQMKLNTKRLNKNGLNLFHFIYFFAVKTWMAMQKLNEWRKCCFVSIEIKYNTHYMMFIEWSHAIHADNPSIDHRRLVFFSSYFAACNTINKLNNSKLIMVQPHSIRN